MAAYDLLRLFHGGIAIVSGSFFLVRGVWLLLDSPLLRVRVVSISPHVIDTLLLMMGVGLSLWSRQYPFVDGWLTAKLAALVAYIGFGLVALRFASTRWLRGSAFVAALLCFGYMLAVAFTRSIAPWQ